MKKTLAVAALLAGAVSGYSQGQVYYGDYLNTDFQITVWSPNSANPTVQTSGNSPAITGPNALASDIPSGTTSYPNSVPLGGSSTGATSPTDYGNSTMWSAELFAASGTATASQLAPIPGTVSSFSNNPASQGYAGLWDYTTSADGGVVTLNGQNGTPTVAIGGPVSVAIGAWYNGGGAYTSYSAAVAAGVPAGMSSVGVVNASGAPNTPPDLPGPGEPQTVSGGITSFSLTTTVPEPSTIALGVMGACAFLARRRKS